MDEDEMLDHCYECSGYGDDYSLDESSELVCNCDTCPCNPFASDWDN